MINRFTPSTHFHLPSNVFCTLRKCVPRIFTNEKLILMSKHNINNYPATAKEYINTFIKYLQSDIDTFKEINTISNSSFNSIVTQSNYILTQSKDDNETKKLTGNVEKKLGSNISETLSYSIKPTDTTKGQMSIPMMLYLFSFMDFVGYLIREDIIKEEKNSESVTIKFILLTEIKTPHRSTSDNILSYLNNLINYSFSDEDKHDIIKLFRHGLTHVGFPKNNYSIITNPSSTDLIIKGENGVSCFNIWKFVILVEYSFSKIEECCLNKPDVVNTNYEFLINFMAGNLRLVKKSSYYEFITQIHAS